jgi:hypothetical protein
MHRDWAAICANRSPPPERIQRQLQAADAALSSPRRASISPSLRTCSPASASASRAMGPLLRRWACWSASRRGTANSLQQPARASPACHRHAPPAPACLSLPGRWVAVDAASHPPPSPLAAAGRPPLWCKWAWAYQRSSLEPPPKQPTSPCWASHRAPSRSALRPSQASPRRRQGGSTDAEAAPKSPGRPASSREGRAASRCPSAAPALADFRLCQSLAGSPSRPSCSPSTTRGRAPGTEPLQTRLLHNPHNPDRPQTPPTQRTST